MKYKELIEIIAERLGSTQRDTRLIVNEVFDVILGELASGEKVSIPQFGIFRTSLAPARKGHNPQNGAEIDIPEQMYARFKASAKMKRLVRVYHLAITKYFHDLKFLLEHSINGIFSIQSNQTKLQKKGTHRYYINEDKGYELALVNLSGRIFVKLSIGFWGYTAYAGFVLDRLDTAKNPIKNFKVSIKDDDIKAIIKFLVLNEFFGDFLAELIGFAKEQFELPSSITSVTAGRKI